MTSFVVDKTTEQTCVFFRCMTQPGSDEMVYRVLLEHATNSAKSSEQSAQSGTNSASDLGGELAANKSCTYQILLLQSIAKNLMS